MCRMRDAPLRVETKIASGGERIITLTGPLTLGSTSELQDVLRRENHKTTILDLAGVPYADSTGIGLLVGAFINAQNAKTNLLLAGVNERIRAALRTARVDQLFVIVADVDKALARVK